MRTLATTSPSFDSDFAALRAHADEVDLNITNTVADVISRIRAEGDRALIELTQQFDRLDLTPAELRIDPGEIAIAAATITPKLKNALELAAARIEAFHRTQLPSDLHFTDAVGADLGVHWTPLDSVGIYVPGGKASYPSSVLMNAIPARIAGVPRIAMVVPAPDNMLDPLVLAAAHLAGVNEVYRIGGAQAVAALAYGTPTIRPVDRIVGPGNAYVAEAKRQVFGHVGIDNIAGPSEILIIADAKNNPSHIALDLIAQAEHAADSQCILITTDPVLADLTAAAISDALRTLPRAAIAAASLRQHGAIILARDLDEAAGLANRIAPEHLQIMTENPQHLLSQIRHAGAIFVGPYAPTAIGDYVAGPNHVLPTASTSRFSSGLSVLDFLKRSTIVSLNLPALAAIGPAAVALAEAENLHGHGRSIRARLGMNEL